MISSRLPKRFWRWVARAAVGLLATLAWGQAPARAQVTVDSFTTVQSTLAAPPDASSTATGGADIVGTKRGIVQHEVAGAGPSTVAVAGGLLTLTVPNTTPDSRAEARLSWDGDNSPAVLNPTGLGTVNLTAGNSGGFRVRVASAGAGAELEFAVYSTAANFSRAARLLPAIASSTDVFLPFSEFRTAGGTGANFASVGAIELTVRGKEITVVLDEIVTSAPILATTKVDAQTVDVDGDTRVDPGDRVRYTVTITNTGNDALAVDLTDAVDANTTLVAGSVHSTPVARNDQYGWFGNVTFVADGSAGKAGLLANDEDGDGDTLTVTSVSPTSSQGGTVTLDDAATGEFTYAPPAGFAGVDSFGYTLQDDDGNSKSATAYVQLKGIVWFVDNACSVGCGQGTLSSPFTTLPQAETASGANDIVYVRSGSGAYDTGAANGFTLDADEQLLGEGVALVLDGTTIVPVGAPPLLTNEVATVGRGVTLAASGTDTVRGLTIGNTAGAKIFGNTFGTLATDTITLNGTGQALDLTSGALAMTLAGLSSTTSAATGVSLATVSGSLTVTGSTSITNPAGTGISIATSTAAASFAATTIDKGASAGTGLSITGSSGVTSFSSLAVTTSAGTGILASGSALTVNGSASTVAATGGPALDLTTVNLGASGATFASASSTGSTGKGMNLDTLTNALTINGGSIGTPAGIAFDLNGGSANVTYAGSISNTANALLVEITGRTAGTVALSGALSSTGSGNGISVASNTGGTINFSNAAKTLTTGADPAVTLSSNSGATINFTGGGLAITTTSGAGFTATGGATAITVQGSGNTISSGSGTALNVASSTIGASGLTFQSVSANGGSKGIALNTTGTGPLSITGTGTTDGTGGTIQNISTRGIELISASNISLKNMNLTGANNSVDAGGATICDDLNTTACNAAIYLSSVSNIALDNLNVTGTMVEEGLNGITVSDLTIANSLFGGSAASACGNEVEEGCLKLRNLTGTCSISNSEFAFAGADAAEIVNTTGNLLLNVNNSTFRDTQASASGNTGLQVRSQSTTVGQGVIVNVNNSSFLRIRTVGLHVTAINSASADVDVTGCTFDPGPAPGTMIGMDLDADNSGVLKFNVLSNTAIYSRNGPAVNVFGDTSAVIDGRINNNPDVQVKSNPGGSQVGSGIRANLNKNASGRIEIKSNVVNIGSDDAGIDLSGIGKTAANPGGGTHTLDATVTGNNVTIGATSTYGIVDIAASGASETNAVCTNVASNAITRNPSSIASFRHRVASAAGFQFLQGFVTNSEATWNANSNTPTSSGGSEVSFGGAGTFGSCTATLPTNGGLTPGS